MSRLNVILLIAFVGLLVWITLFQPQQISRIQSGALVVFRPFMKASSRLESGVESVGSEPISRVELQGRIEELERERDRLQLEVIQLDDLARENNELRRALQYVERAPLSVVAARVINRKPSTWYSTMIIDKGSLHGVAVDSPVIVPSGEEAALVGKISEVVGENSAIVLLLTDEMCQVSAKLIDSQEQGILSGQRGVLRQTPDLRLRYLSKEAEIAPGRKVVSSGAGGLFPPDLVLGEVISLEIGSIDAEAAVRPGVNFEELLDVFVVLPAGEEGAPDGETVPDEPDDSGETIESNPLTGNPEP